MYRWRNSRYQLPRYTGVRQGCVVSSLLFIIAIDWVIKRTVQNYNTGIRWTLLSNLQPVVDIDDLATLAYRTSYVEQNIRPTEEFQHIGP